jgi:selenocysteine-specific elongation factor
MKHHTIIGTAGHIDHGKTALIRALTGIDADRLKEEKERGITIDIGFAYWKDEVTIIDVPGHEKFIRNMVAGVSAIDIFMLVIAADDGIMPQTIEHLDILHFFNIRNGMVVINKCDLADPDWLDLVEEEIRQLLVKYQLHDTPIIRASAVSGENIDTVRDVLEQKIAALTPQQNERPFRLFVDRSFSIHGFGTVVTGAVISGQLPAGQEVQIMPSGRTVKVRGLQTHTSDVNRVEMGDRAAINLQGIEKEQVLRGHSLSLPGTTAAVSEFTGIIRTVSKIAVRIANRSAVRVYVGTAEVLGTLIWFDTDKLLREEQSYHVRIKLNEPVSAVHGDAFLVRLQSPLITLAGGKILEINPGRIRHSEAEWTSYFRRMDNNEPEVLVEETIRNRGIALLTGQSLQQKLFREQEFLSATLEKLLKRKRIRRVESKNQPAWIHSENFDTLVNRMVEIIGDFHRKNPQKAGLTPAGLVAGIRIKSLAEELLEAALQKAVNAGEVIRTGAVFALPGFQPQVTRDAVQLEAEILKIYFDAGFMPPELSGLTSQLNIRPDESRNLTAALQRTGKLVSVKGQYYLHHERLAELLDALRSHFAQNETISVPDLKNYINTTRKYAIPLLEFLDGEGYTRRDGDARTAGPGLKPD